MATGRKTGERAEDDSGTRHRIGSGTWAYWTGRVRTATAVRWQRAFATPNSETIFSGKQFR